MPPAISIPGPSLRMGARPLPRRRAVWARWFDAMSTLTLGGLVLAGALFYVWQHTRVVRTAYEIERLREARATLVQENKALRLETGQLRALKRVEDIARTRLGMVTPRAGQVVLVPEAPIQ